MIGKRRMLNVKSLDVLRNPCINTVYISGETKMINLREAVRDAHIISCIAYNGYPKIFEFAIYKFLMLFTQNIYRPTWDEIEDLWGAGKFDMDVFDAYTAKYECDGFSFDLFGDIPFMQMSKKEFAEKEWSGKSEPIAVLDPLLKTGNNEIFFGMTKRDPSKKVEDTYTFSDEKLFASILCAALYPLFTGAGYVPSATGSSGSTPVCALYSGDNLFETLILNYAYMTKQEYENTVPFWEKEDRLPDLTKTPESYLNYACIPSAKISLKDADSAIRVVKGNGLYTSGEKPQELLSDYLVQNDPNLILRETQETATDENGKKTKVSKNIPLTSHKLKKGIYLQLARIDVMRSIDNSKKKLIYDKLELLGLEDKKLTVTFYGQGIKSTSGDYVEIYETFNGIDAVFLSEKSQERARVVTDYISETNQKLAYIYEQYINEIRTKTNKIDSPQKTSDICAEYLDDIREIFLNKYAPVIEGNGDIKDIKLDISRICRDKFASLPVLAGDYITKGKWANILYYSLDALTNPKKKGEKK